MSYANEALQQHRQRLVDEQHRYERVAETMQEQIEKDNDELETIKQQIDDIDAAQKTLKEHKNR